ncbi:putative replication factor C subunit [Gregarina niphandrodes]|uniref:Replication factor C subunit n=1 Tax=Gregarina niphandrodes TaxID=110365 RepID=A0A023AY05_GRENI|nr:putative replication factor C subunit [Gregarina niphandrodes]EZG43170.1 putative replication factor C subunit [Gregarina niphandrodes]|eukprot:XP_011133577.1 putative replication factor C subunit [Gregarina niphandrodes]
MESIWVEKYRPQSLDELTGNPAGLRLLRSQIHQPGGLQHLLLCGPAGVGKTSSLHCLARAILGDQYSSQTCLELNAADDRGIDVVRERIKNFAKNQVRLEPGRFKIVILDEVEAMTEGAQQALRRLMEQYSDTRFALACNQSEKVIDPIQSRCVRVPMTRLKNEEMKGALVKICDKENISYQDDAMQELIEAADGDLRKAIGSLQAAATAFGKVEIPSVYHACDIPPTEDLHAAFDACRKGIWRDAHDAIFKLLDQGYSGIDVLKALRGVCIKSDAPDAIKILCQKEVTTALISNDRALDHLQVE